MLHASVVYGTLAVLITEGLGLAGWLTRTGLATSWATVVLAASAYLVRESRAREAQESAATAATFSSTSATVNLADRALALGTATIVGLVGVVALVSPPNTWDAMAYHMPRVVHWLQNRSVAFYATHELRQLHMTPGAEFLVLQLHGLSGSDQFDNLVQWFAFAGSVIGVTLIARSLGASPRGQVLAAFVCATIPEGILQASGAKNDYVLTFWLVALAFYFLALKTEPTRANILGASAALALACFTKATAYVLAAPMLVAWILILPAGARAVLLKHLPVTLLIFGSLNAGQYLRNYELYRAVLGPVSEASNEFKYTNDALSPSVVVSNVVRNVSMHLSTSSPSLNDTIARRASDLLRALKIDPNNPATTWTSSRFELPTRPRHEALAANPAHLVLIALTLLVLLLRGPRTSRDLMLYCLGLLLAFLAFCAVLKWQPFHSRLHLPLFVLWAAPTALVFTSGRGPYVAYGVAAALLFLSTDAVLKNELRPLSGRRHSTILRQDRATLYFADHPFLIPSYKTAVEVLRDTGCRDIGLDLSLAGDQAFEYPLLVLLGAGGRDMDVRQVGTMNASARYAAPFTPCAVLCARCSTAIAKWRQYIPGFPDRLIVGNVVLFLPKGASERAVPSDLVTPIRLSVNGGRFRPGDELVVGLQVWYPLDQIPADLYVGAFLPEDGRMLFLAGADGTMRLAQASTPSAFVRFAPVPPGLLLDEPRLVEFTLPKRGVPNGAYQIFAVLVRQGALEDNRVDPGDILALDMTHLVVSP